MKVWQRRVWSWIIGLMASALISLGVLVGLFRIAVEVAPGYRQDLAEWVGGLLGRPVRIAGLDLAWRGLYPTLILRDVVIEADGGPLTRLDELQVGFAVQRLVVGDLVPARVVLIGPRVALINGPSGVRLEGISSGGQGIVARDLASRLLDIGEVLIRDASVVYRDTLRGLPTRRFDEIDLSARPLGVGFELKVDQVIIDRGIGRASGMAVFPTLELPPQRLKVDLEGWFPWEEARELINGFPPVAARLDRLTIDAFWRGDSFVAGSGRVEFGDAGLLDRDAALHQVQADYRIERTGAGYHADISELQVTSPLGAWPSNALSVDLRRQADERWNIAFDAAYLRLGDLMAWSPLLREPQREQLESMSPGGELLDVVGHWSSGGGLPTLSATLQGVRWHAAGKLPGISGLSGRLSMDESRGRFDLDSEQFSLELSEIFEQVLPVSRARAQVNWQRTDADWQVVAEDIEILALGLSANGSIKLSVGEKREIDLALSLSTDDPRPWLMYQPQFWSPNLRQWLAQSVLKAKLPRGEVRIQGDLADFPFRSGAGQFLVDLQIADLDLKYSPLWPEVRGTNARLRIDADKLEVQANGGRIAGSQIVSAKAGLKIQKRNTIKLQAKARADASRLLGFLEVSPLKDRFQDLLSSVSLTGPATVDVELSLPLHDLDKTQFKGHAKFNGVTLKTRHWPEPVREIVGEFDIREAGLSGRGLKAKMEQQDFEFTLAADSGLTRIKATTLMDLSRHGPDWDVPGWLSRQGKGQSRFNIELAVGGEEFSPIVIRSDLVGTTLSLPRPYAKSASQVRQVELIADPRPEGVELKFKYARLLSTHLVFGKDSNSVSALHLRLGAEPAPRPSAPGLWIDGRSSFVSFGEVYDFVRSMDGDGEDLRFGGLVVTVDGADAFGQRMSSLRVQATADQDSWFLSLAGADAQGRLNWPRIQRTERGEVTGRFDRLHWGFSMEQGADEEPIEPSQFPGLDLKVKNFILNDQPLGALDLQLKPLDHGIQISRLIVGDPAKPQFDLKGDWLRDARGSQGRFDFQMDTNRFSFWLAAFGYEESIRASRGRLNGHVQWPPTLGGLTVEAVSGELGLAFNQGQILAVEPGAGRMLGLISVNALPRRLFLDFRDVVDSGLAFDRIGGKFQIVDGNAFTDKLTVNSPSLRIESRGRVGLAARDYDQTVSIYPSLSSGVTLAATVLGGPAVGLFTMFFQELLDQPIDQAGQLSYHLGGTWDNPEVSKPR